MDDNVMAGLVPAIEAEAGEEEKEVLEPSVEIAPKQEVNVTASVDSSEGRDMLEETDKKVEEDVKEVELSPAPEVVATENVATESSGEKDVLPITLSVEVKPKQGLFKSRLFGQKSFLPPVPFSPTALKERPKVGIDITAVRAPESNLAYARRPTTDRQQTPHVNITAPKPASPQPTPPMVVSPPQAPFALPQPAPLLATLTSATLPPPQSAALPRENVTLAHQLKNTLDELVAPINAPERPQQNVVTTTTTAPEQPKQDVAPSPSADTLLQQSKLVPNNIPLVVDNSKKPIPTPVVEKVPPITSPQVEVVTMVIPRPLPAALYTPPPAKQASTTAPLLPNNARVQSVTPDTPAPLQPQLQQHVNNVEVAEIPVPLPQEKSLERKFEGRRSTIPDFGMPPSSQDAAMDIIASRQPLRHFEHEENFHPLSYTLSPSITETLRLSKERLDSTFATNASKKAPLPPQVPDFMREVDQWPSAQDPDDWLHPIAGEQADAFADDNHEEAAAPPGPSPFEGRFDDIGASSSPVFNNILDECVQQMKGMSDIDTCVAAELETRPEILAMSRSLNKCDADAILLAQGRAFYLDVNGRFDMLNPLELDRLEQYDAIVAEFKMRAEEDIFKMTAETAEITRDLREALSKNYDYSNTLIIAYEHVCKLARNMSSMCALNDKQLLKALLILEVPVTSQAVVVIRDAIAEACGSQDAWSDHCPLVVESLIAHFKTCGIQL